MATKTKAIIRQNNVDTRKGIDHIPAASNAIRVQRADSGERVIDRNAYLKYAETKRNDFSNLINRVRSKK